MICALATLVVATGAGLANAGCTLTKFADLPVTMQGLRATIPTQLDGVDAIFAIDTGAFYTSLTAASAERLHLKLRAAPADKDVIEGIGGDAQVYLTTVKVFSLGAAKFHGFSLIVGGSEYGNEVVGLFGQNVLIGADLEFDFANGAMRVFRTSDCGGQMLAYWDTNQPYSVIHTSPTTHESPWITSTATVNGVTMRVLFDTGFPQSYLSLDAAKRAGIDPHGPGVVDGGATGGIGRGALATWIAPVASFKIGDEEIKNTHLRIADGSMLGHDMVLGADFFLSHRIFSAGSQQKLYFTYNGGPVFDLNHASENDRPGASSPALAPAPTATSQSGGGSVPTDAQGFARRGAAYTSRGDYPDAVADLTRAIDLDPADADYRYARAMAYLGSRQAVLARADLDRALEITPAYVPALMARAQLRLAMGSEAEALVDLHAADRAAPPAADGRLELGALFTEADAEDAAVNDLDLWINSHLEDAKRPEGLGERCWARALAGQLLDKALADCNVALGLWPKDAAVLDSRGLVHLRLGDLDRAIADYDAALALNPKLAWSLYGRGVAKIKKGNAVAGNVDITAALAVQANIATKAKAHGIGG